jgi:hypothetical protein
MKITKLKNDLKIPLFGILGLLLMLACKTEKKAEQETKVAPKKNKVIEVVTENMDFQLPDTIPSGWNVFHYINKSPQTHFILIDKYPEGKTVQHAADSVAPVFDRGMELINEGKPEEGFAEFANLPSWFGQVEFLGGTGLLSPGNTGKTMVHLNPGYYILECYVKMSNGKFHTSMGMTKELIVSDRNSEVAEWEADINIEISGEAGIVIKDSITTGKKVFSVTYKDQKVHENFVGHDVSLAKVEATANLYDLEKWMNWADPKGLIEPAPAGVNFLGGVNDMPGGSKGYFKANLEAGTYVLISEVPNASQKNMMLRFTLE